MVYECKKILAVGAHPDDVELGCGGTLSQITKKGGKVTAVFLTKGEISGDPAIRMDESKKAMSILGISDVFFGDFQDAKIPDNHETITFLERFCIETKPDVIFTHTRNDIHQDHRTIGWLSLAAFRSCPKILAYETPRVTADFRPQYFIDISNSIKDKYEALNIHASQKNKRYIAYESMVNLASFRGSQVGVPAAEAFEILKYLETIL